MRFMLEGKEDKQLSKWLIISCLLAFVCLVFTYGILHMQKPATVHVSQTKVTDVYVKIKPGMNAEKIANLLYENGITEGTLGFRIMAKIHGLDSSLKAGDYAFNKKMTYSEIIDILVQGKTSAFNLTIPEGYNINQIGKLLEEKGIAKASEFENLAKTFAPYDYMVMNADSKYRAEGFLFPDTYQVANGQTAKDVLTMMSKQFDGQFTPEMRMRAEKLGLSVRETVILASLVEKEAQIDTDRPIIAQVFMNRLRAFMPLQSCATIQYILGYAKPELTIQDTKIESPYNSYQHMGLPPGPIANPGLASIKAVLYSEPTEYLYFVADKNGKHHFSKTYEEHLREIDRIQ
jgi:UPF0755 protein